MESLCSWYLLAALISKHINVYHQWTKKTVSTMDGRFQSSKDLGL